METKYSVPRYLGLNHAKRVQGGHYHIELGYSSQLRRELELDDSGLKLLRSCLKPKSIGEIEMETGLPQIEVSYALKSLGELDIVKPVSEVPSRQSRYDRHLLFFDLQGADAVAAREKISNATIALIGMGGIGSWVSTGLIGAGFKELKLIDFDTVELSNLTRQILYTESDIGQSKTKVAAQRLRERNSQTQITPVDIRVGGSEDLREPLADVDLVVVSADRPAKIHDWVDEVCISLGIPYINLGYRDGYGIVGPLTEAGTTSCYQCFKPSPSENIAQKPTEEASLIEDFEARYQAPSFGPLNAIVSSVGVLEVMKQITGLAPCRSMEVELEIDPMTFEIRETSYPRDPSCWHCGK